MVSVLILVSLLGALNFSDSLVMESCFNRWHLESPQLHFGAELRVNGTISIANSDLCSSRRGNREVLHPSTILLTSSGGCSFERKARSAQILGALSLIISRERPGPAGEEALERDGSDTRGISIPVVVVSRKDGWFIRHFEDGSSMCTISNEDPNPWVEMRTSWWYIALFQGACGSYAAYLVLLSAYRIDLCLRRGLTRPNRILSGAALTPRLLCALLVGLANLERLIYFAVDPFMSREVFTVLQSHLLLSLSIPFSLATTALATYDLTKGIEQMNQRLGGRTQERSSDPTQHCRPLIGSEAKRVKRPLQASVACALAVELVTSTLLGLQLDATLGQAALIMKATTYFVLSVLLGGMFLMKCSQMRRDLQFYRARILIGAEAGRAGNVDWLDEASHRMTVWGNVTGGCTLVLALCCLLVATPLFHSPHSQMVVLLLASLLGLFTTSLGHLRFFAEGTAGSRRSSSKREGARGEKHRSARSASTRKRSRSGSSSVGILRNSSGGAASGRVDEAWVNTSPTSITAGDAGSRRVGGGAVKARLYSSCATTAADSPSSHPQHTSTSAFSVATAAATVVSAFAAKIRDDAAAQIVTTSIKRNSATIEEECPSGSSISTSPIASTVDAAEAITVTPSHIHVDISNLEEEGSGVEVPFSRPTFSIAPTTT